jgi:hypothetical protein
MLIYVRSDELTPVKRETDEQEQEQEQEQSAPSIIEHEEEVADPFENSRHGSDEQSLSKAKEVEEMLGEALAYNSNTELVGEHHGDVA